MKNYVTGAGGMVGSHMVEFLHDNGDAATDVPVTVLWFW